MNRLAFSTSLIAAAAAALLLVLSVPVAASAAQEAEAEVAAVAETADAAEVAAAADPAEVMDGMGVTEAADGPEASGREIAEVTGETGWRFDTYYLLPLTRHMPGSGLPFWGQVMLYPLSAAIDLIQLPVGALVGLAGE